jgi:hypothetical protein|tara:strand:- start:1233 stop:2405 length:1173 start_codon:yes stop_codon:yes gene_type:complete
MNKHLTHLTSRKIEFVTALSNAGLKSPVSRADLADVCDASGIYAAPPSWITQDDDRYAGRALYFVNELKYIKTEKVSAPVRKPVAPQPATTANMVMGMTGGDRNTLVPNKFDGYVAWGHFKDVEKIVKSKQQINIFITGLSGNGKTLMIEQVCAKLKRECYRVNITRQTDEDDLLGGFRLINGSTKWCDGPVVTAMKNGGVLLLDEVDLASNNIMCLQSVLEGKGVFLKKIGQWVTPAHGFQVFATANTKGKGSEDGRFVGTAVMNEAFLDRFPITMEQPYATRATERKILTKAGCEDADFADNLTKWAEIIRKTFMEGGIDEVISTRRLVNIVETFNIFGDKMQALGLCMNRFDDLTKNSLMDLYTKVDGDVPVDADVETSAKGNECPF